MVQILINLYRYNTRAAAEYLSFADAILLENLDAEKISEIQETFSLNTAFGRAQPTMPKKLEGMFKALSDELFKRLDRKVSGTSTELILSSVMN